MSESISVAIVEDDPGIRAGWKAIVDRLPGYVAWRITGVPRRRWRKS